MGEPGRAATVAETPSPFVRHTMATSICWFRRDLRLDDNPTWSAATSAETTVAVWVRDDRLLDAAGPFRRRRLLADVAALDAELRALGGGLHVIAGDAATVLGRLVVDSGASAVHATADVTPYAASRDAAVAEALDVPIEWTWGGLVQPPGSVTTAQGQLSRVFSAFHRRWATMEVPPTPAVGDADIVVPAGAGDLPEVDADPIVAAGSDGAHERLARFCEIVDEYPDLRDLPAIEGTSGLSADLRFGTIGPREVIDAVGTHTPGREAFVRQLAWRDWYAHHLLLSPHHVSSSVRPEYDAVAWRDDDEGFEAWRTGRTGYPIVDAGMRELAATGTMHNRVRMIAASFLVKDLLVDWRRGERWFRHVLVDGDVAQNVGNWQWVAGTGHDAAPYFRIFNPVTQSERFDPDGVYIRRWVPELASLTGRAVHAPWTAGPLELAAAGVVLGDDYPAPIVDHAMARDRTIAAYKAAVG